MRLTGVIGSAGRFRQGIDFSGQQEIIKKAFSFKKSEYSCNINKFARWFPSSVAFDTRLHKTISKKNNKKVIVFAEDVAASGGYLIACSGDEIYANSVQ